MVTMYERPNENPAATLFLASKQIDRKERESRGHSVPTVKALPFKVYTGKR